jgi:hypothetical protein
MQQNPNIALDFCSGQEKRTVDAKGQKCLTKHGMLSKMEEIGARQRKVKRET